MTTKLLLPFLRKLASARKTTDVSGVAMDAIRGPFASRVGGVLLLDESLAPVERDIVGMRSIDVEEYEAHWRAKERVFPVVISRAIPVHNWQVYSEEEWRKDSVWVDFGRRLGVYHYMSAPIFGSHGCLAGVLNFCRRPADAPFDATTLEMASAFSGFLSATLSRLDGVRHAGDEYTADGLAPRELQVARLAALGRNNVEIALSLGIARETVKQTLGRVYRKFDVSGRAAMAATLATRGLLHG